MPTFVLYTLGCKVNQYESEYVREALHRLGYKEASRGEGGDLIIINTCTVTAESDLKARKAIRHLHRQHPRAPVVVMGCYAARAAQELMQLPGVRKVLPTKQAVAQWLSELGLEQLPHGICRFGSRHRAFVKVQDGCQQRCTYCIIPLVRPVLQSRRPEEILTEIQRLVSAGYQEIVLTGIHLGWYGRDLPEPRPTLVQLLRQILQLPGSFRVRLSSLEAREVSRELLQWMAQQPQRLCPHLHLPLQSGSDRILQRMGRPYRLADFLQICEQIQDTLPNPALSTDLLVGFPGEREEDFLATCRAVERIGFSKVHIFPFSARPGTPAAQLPERVPPPVLRRRCTELAELANSLRRRYLQSLLGEPAQVLVEEISPFPTENFPPRGSPEENASFPAAEEENCPARSLVFSASRSAQVGAQEPFSPSETEACFPQEVSLPMVAQPTKPARVSCQADLQERGQPSGWSSGNEGEDCFLPGNLSSSPQKAALCQLQGTSERYVPVRLQGPQAWIGRLISVRLHRLLGAGPQLAVWARPLLPPEASW